MTFDTIHSPSTSFEKYLKEFIDICVTISKHIPKTTPEKKAVKAGIVYYNSAYSNTMKQGKAHESNLPSFTRFAMSLPDNIDDLVTLEWLTSPTMQQDTELLEVTASGENQLLLRFVRESDGVYAAKVMLNLTAIYESAVDEIDQLHFAFLVLRCCEAGEIGAKKQAIIGRAAQELEISFENLDDDRQRLEGGDDGDDDSFMSGVKELKKRVMNPKIWKTMFAEGSELLTTAQSKPELIQTLEGLMSEEKSPQEKLNLVKQYSDSLPNDSNDEKTLK